MTGTKCDGCSKFLERSDNPEWNNSVEIETEHRESNKTYHFFMCQSCAEEQEVNN